MRLIPILISIFTAPMSLCIIIILQVVICSIDVLNHKNNIWLNFIFILIFFGGVIVLLVYVSRVSQNELITFKFWLYPFILFSTLTIQHDYYNISSTRSCVGSVCFRGLGWWLSVILIIYLFVVIIIVVKITDPYTGALRVE